MRNIISRAALWLAAACLVAACGGSTTPAPSDGPPDPIERALDHQEAILDLLEAHQRDPDEAVRALEAFAREHQETFDAIRAEGAVLAEELKEKPAATFRRFERHSARLEALSQRQDALRAASPELMDRQPVRELLGRQGHHAPGAPR